MNNEQTNNVFLKCKDHLVSGETFELLYDSSYEMLKTNPQPEVRDLSKYYESENYISHTDSKKGLVSFLYQSVKKYALKKKVSLITNLNNGPGSLLDVGAGTGDFLSSVKNAGWTIEGVEVSDHAKKIASNKGIFLKQDLKEIKDIKFDVITLWHVLEHIPNLEVTINTLESLLKPNGKLIIAVPNFKSYDANYYKEFWAAYDVPRHLWHFSQHSISKLFSNFRIQKTKPMIFDSFYVSLLSEKYKTNSSFSISAIFIGLWSNIKAMGSGEYSSLIYCLQKQK